MFLIIIKYINIGSNFMICKNCGKEHDGSYGSGKFCSKECARAFSTKNSQGQLKKAKCIDCNKIIYIGLRASDKNCRCEECKNKYNESKLLKSYQKKYKTKTLKINYKNKSNCNIFNDIKCDECYFKIHNICKSKSGISYKLQTLQKYCNLNISSNYLDTLKNYLEIKNNIQNLINNNLSTVDICNALCNSSKKGNTIFTILQINCRNLSEAVSNAYIQGKVKSKEGYYLTWDNKEVFLRSSYEEDYAKELDQQCIEYEVECFHIKYWDSQLLKYRCAIPDFYIPSTNTIVEIKSNWTLDKQNMKDKFKAYKELGYNCKLICDHKEMIL